MLYSREIGGLLRLAAEISTASPSTVETLAEVLLAIPSSGREKSYGRSTLNNDGSPIQLCVTSTEHECRFRLLGDPAAILGDPRERVAAGYQALSMLLNTSQVSSLKPLCDQTWQCSLPADPSTVPQFASGVCWLASGVNSPGIALYITSRWGPVEERWPRALNWLESILPNADVTRTLVTSLAQHASLESMGLEGISRQHARAKLYWRLRHPISLGDLNISILAHPAISQFLAAVLQDEVIALSGLVFSVGFSLATGALTDAKIDICAHCKRMSPSMWVELIDDCVETYHLTPLPTKEALIQQRCKVAFLGLGLDQQSTPRLNLYLKIP